MAGLEGKCSAENRIHLTGGRDAAIAPLVLVNENILCLTKQAVHEFACLENILCLTKQAVREFAGLEGNLDVKNRCEFHSDSRQKGREFHFEKSIVRINDEPAFAPNSCKNSAYSSVALLLVERQSFL